MKKVQQIEYELNEKASYLKRDRAYGQGTVRIGRAMEFSEDIYSLTFAS